MATETRRTEWTLQERHEQQSKRVAMLWKALLDAEDRIRELEHRLATTAKPAADAAHAPQRATTSTPARTQAPAAPTGPATVGKPAAATPAPPPAVTPAAPLPATPTRRADVPEVIDTTERRPRPLRIPVDRLSAGERAAPIEAVEGIGPTYGAQMRAAGVETVEDLFLADPAGVARRTGISPGLVDRWHDQVLLQAIHGVGPQFSELLVRAGVRDVRQLADARPAELAKQLKAYEAGLEHRVQGRTVTLDMVADWVRQAREVVHGEPVHQPREPPVSSPPKPEP